MARVLIADDHAVVRAGLKQFLVEDRGISAIGEAATGRETLDRLRAEAWDLVILDIGMPDRSGIDILQQIRAVHDRTRVLVLSGYPERQYALNDVMSARHWPNSSWGSSTAMPTSRCTRDSRNANSRCSASSLPAARSPRSPLSCA
jgi:CheY-like chemotaxis protein